MNKIQRVLRLGREFDLVILVSLLWFMVQFLRFAFPPLFDTFQGIYGVSNTETGFMFTSMMVAYSIIQVPAGVYSDKFGRPLIMVVGLCTFTLSSLFISNSINFMHITIFAILIGLGTGPHKAVAIPLLSDQYENRTGRALGAMDTIGQFGGMVAPLVVIFFLSLSAWGGVFITASIFSALLGLLLLIKIHNSDELKLGASSTKEQFEGSSSTTRRYLDVFHDVPLLLFILVTVIFTFAWNGFSVFYPLFLVAEKGVTSSTASGLYSLLFAASLSQAFTGELSDRVGRPQIGFLLFFLTSVSVLLLLVVEHLVILTALTFAIGIGFHGFRPVRDAYLMDLIPKDIGGGILGIIRTFMTGVGALSPAIVGWLSDNTNFAVAYGMLGAVVISGCLLMVILYNIKK